MPQSSAKYMQPVCQFGQSSRVNRRSMLPRLCCLDLIWSSQGDESDSCSASLSWNKDQETSLLLFFAGVLFATLDFLFTSSLTGFSVKWIYWQWWIQDDLLDPSQHIIYFCCTIIGCIVDLHQSSINTQLKLYWSYLCWVSFTHVASIWSSTNELTLHLAAGWITVWF